MPEAGSRIRRIMRVAAWVGVAGCAVIVCAWCFTLLGGTFGIGSLPPFGDPQVKISDNSLWINLGTGWLQTVPPRPKYLGFVYVPFFVILLPAAFVTALLWIASRPRRPPHACQQCGYDLTGNVSGRCSECGAPIQRDESSDRPAP